MEATMQGRIGQQRVWVAAGPATLEGALAVPPRAQGMVVFAHGSGSSRLSPRNQFVAAQLHSASLATLLFDLLTPGEEASDVQTRQLRFDIGLLAERLVGVTDWLTQQPAVNQLPIG